ncbi:hypothetical protein ABG067_009521, partial [Albugo candida]
NEEDQGQGSGEAGSLEGHGSDIEVPVQSGEDNEGDTIVEDQPGGQEAEQEDQTQQETEEE